MARILIGNASFDGVPSRSWYERDYESLVVDRAASLFPDWLTVPFHETVIDDSQVGKQSDLALIDKEYRTWWVVEVELAHHSLDGHVMPQVQVFRQGHYGPRHAAALVTAAPHLDAHRLRALVSGEPPNVLVVVDSPTTAWREPLRRADVQLAIVEPFRDAHGTTVLRLNGDQPRLPSNQLSRCTRMQGMRRLWRLHSPASVPAGDLLIEWEGSVSRWVRTSALGGATLRAERGDLLAGWAAVDLVRSQNGQMTFRPVQPLRRNREA